MYRSSIYVLNELPDTCIYITNTLKAQCSLGEIWSFHSTASLNSYQIYTITLSLPCCVCCRVIYNGDVSIAFASYQYSTLTTVDSNLWKYYIISDIPIMFDVLKYLLCAAWCTFCNNDQRLRVPHQDLEEKIHYIYIYSVKWTPSLLPSLGFNELMPSMKLFLTHWFLGNNVKLNSVIDGWGILLNCSPVTVTWPH